MCNNYYVYGYLREDGTPYYIGKGRHQRRYDKRGKNVSLPPSDRNIILKGNLTEEDSFKWERYYIYIYGRKDLGTGILRNLTDGGDGNGGRVQSQEERERRSVLMKEKHKRGEIDITGENNPFYGKTHTQETRKKIGSYNEKRCGKKVMYNGVVYPSMRKCCISNGFHKDSYKSIFRRGGYYLDK